MTALPEGVEKARKAASDYVVSQMSGYGPCGTTALLENAIEKWMAGGVNGDDVRGFIEDAVNAALDTLPATFDALRAEAMREGYDEVLTLVRQNEATCRDAERERTADIRKRDENASIMPMLYEQRYAWEQKAESYKALALDIEKMRDRALATAPVEKCPRCHGVGDITIPGLRDPGEDRNVACPECSTERSAAK